MRRCVFIAAALLWCAAAPGFAENDGRVEIERLLSRVETGDDVALDEILRLGLPGARILSTIPKSSARREKTISTLVDRMTKLVAHNFERSFPGNVSGIIPKSQPLFVTVIDSKQELDVWLDAYRAQNGSYKNPNLTGTETLMEAETLLCIGCFHQKNVIKAVQGRRSLDGNTCVFQVELTEKEFTDLPVRGGDASFFERTLVFDRKGSTVAVYCEILGELEKNILTFTGGGMSPLDDPKSTQAQAEDAYLKKDFLAVRRWLRRKLNKGEFEAVDAMKFIGCEDPFTSYWAAKVLAAQGDYVRLRGKCELLRRNDGLDDYVVSAIFHAVIEGPLVEKRDAFLTDEAFLRKMCIIEQGNDSGYTRAGWLFVLLKGVLPKEKWDALINTFSNAADQEARELAKRVEYQVRRNSEP